MDEHAAEIDRMLKELWENTPQPGYLIWPTPQITERIDKQCTAHYNASHPNRKISWRRLNRQQQIEAFEMFGIQLVPILSSGDKTA